MNAHRWLPWLFSTVLFLAGGAIGYFVGLDRSQTHERSLGTNIENSATDARSGSIDRVTSFAARTDGKASMNANSSAPRIGVRENDALISRFAECLLERTEDERHAVWLGLLRQLRSEDASAVCALFRNLGNRNGNFAFAFEWSSFWRKWGQVDGSSAMAYLAETEDDGPTAELARLVLSGWAQKDPDSAAQWLARHADVPNYAEALIGLIDGSARRDYLDATQFAVRAIKGDAQNGSEIAEILADNALLQAGVPGLLTWFEQIPNDKDSAALKQHAATALISRLQQADPARAMQWITGHVDSWRDDDAIGSTADRVATTIDSETALNWLTSLPPSTSGGAYPGMNRVVRRFATSDPAALEQWLRTPKPQDMQDQALAAYARALRETNPDTANQWIAQIKDPRWNPSAEAVTADFVVDGALQRSFKVLFNSSSSKSAGGARDTLTILQAGSEKR